jgi:hypothetical protein
MPLIFKLTNQPNNNIHIIKAIEDTININHINDMFKQFGLDDEELSKIKYLTDSDIIRDPSQTFVIKNDETRIIFIFSSDFMIRHKLQEIFTKNGIEQEQTIDINKPLNIKASDTIPVMTPEKISEMNKKTIELFSDPEFVLLLKIVTKKPHYINMVAKYIQKGTIVMESLGPVKTVSELSSEELDKYKELAAAVILDVPEELKINMLIKYNGHINLTLRAILSEKNIESSFI